MSGGRGASVVWFAAAGVLAVAATVVGVVVIVAGIVRYDDRIDDFQRVEVPGSGELTFLEDGGYTGYYETPFACELSCAPRLSIEVEPVDGTATVPVDGYDGTFTYSSDGRHGEAVVTMEIPEPGRYRIRVADVSESGFRGQLAVGRSIGRVILHAVLVGSAVIAVGVFAAGMAVLVGGLRRVAAQA